MFVKKIGENGASGLIHTILHTFDTTYAEKLRKCLALRDFGEIFTQAI